MLNSQPERCRVAASRLTDDGLAAMPDPRDREEQVFGFLIDLAETENPPFLIHIDTDDRSAIRRLGYLLDMTNVVLDARNPDALEKLSMRLRQPAEPAIKLIGGVVGRLTAPDYDDFAVRWGIVDPVFRPRFLSHYPAIKAARFINQVKTG